MRPSKDGRPRYPSKPTLLGSIGGAAGVPCAGVPEMPVGGRPFRRKPTEPSPRGFQIIATCVQPSGLATNSGLIRVWAELTPLAGLRSVGISTVNLGFATLPEKPTLSR